MPLRVGVALVLAFVPMVVEAARSQRHERLLRARGAVEPARDVHAIMRVAYPGAFVLTAVEGWWRDVGLDGWFATGLVVWTLSKVLKYWAIRALGPLWSFRVLVPPDLTVVAEGPYRFLRHPNYVAVSGELVAAALLCPAPLVGTVALGGFGLLLRRRVAVEEEALARRPPHPDPPSDRPAGGLV